MLTASRCARLSFSLSDLLTSIYQELINFPPLTLSPSARHSLNALLSSSPSTSEAAAMGQSHDPFLPPSIPNPALSHDQMDADDMGAWAFGGGGVNGPYGEGVPYRAADREDGSGKDKGATGSWKNGGGFSSVRNGGIRLRAPIERRWVTSRDSKGDIPDCS